MAGHDGGGNRDRDLRAALAGHEPQIMTHLLAECLDQHLRYKLGSAFLACAEAGDISVFSALRDAGVKIPRKERSRSDMTILGCAAFGGSVEIVAAVLQTEAGAEMLDYTFRRGEKVTALHVAIEREAFGVAIQLLDAGANDNIASRYGVVPLHLAAKAGCVELVQRLTRASNVNTLTSSNQSPLHMAALQSQPSCVNILVEAGADLDVRDTEGCTPLYLALAHDNLAVVMDLLTRGADTSIIPVPRRRFEPVPEYWEDRQLGFPPCLALAAARGRLAVVQALLLKPGATVRSSIGATAIHFAARGSALESVPRDRSDVINALAEQLDVNDRFEADGTCPLHLACSYSSSSPENVRALLARGANPNATDNAGNAPLHIACSKSLVDVAGILLRYGADATKLNGQGQAAEAVVGSRTRVDVAESANESIRAMLARARRWHRRSWLVLCREAPKKVQLVASGWSGEENLQERDIDAKLARVTGGGKESESTAAGARERNAAVVYGGGSNVIDLAYLVHKLCQVAPDEVFRNVVTCL